MPPSKVCINKLKKEMRDFLAAPPPYIPSVFVNERNILGRAAIHPPVLLLLLPVIMTSNSGARACAAQSGISSSRGPRTAPMPAGVTLARSGSR